MLMAEKVEVRPELGPETFPVSLQTPPRMVPSVCFACMVFLKLFLLIPLESHAMYFDLCGILKRSSVNI